MKALVPLAFILLLLGCEKEKKDSPPADDIPTPLPPGARPNLPPPSPGDGEFVSFGQVESDQLAILSEMGANERLNTRFLSICENSNQGKPLSNYEAAINKAINSISDQRATEPASEAGGTPCTKSIDLRDYGLSVNDWDLIVAKNPFVRTFESFTSRGVLVKQLTQERQAWMPGHVFIFTIFDATVYPRLLNLPGTLAELQFQLGVNLQRDFDDEDDKTFLFGHTQSPIALGKPRLHLRTESIDGFYYQSYDVISENIGQDNKNIFQSPFPVEARSLNTLIPDGHEVIFSLPNGLLGFFLADGNGLRQEFAPLNLVVDTEASGIALDPTIRYLSCNRCHANGLIERRDEVFAKVKADNSFGNIDVQKSAFWHGRAAQLSQELRQDNTQFLGAMERLRIGASEFDHINFYTDKLRQESNLEQVAALMFMTPEDFSRALRGTTTSLNQIGSLLNGDTISFDQLRQTLPIFVIEANIFRDDFGG